MSLVAVPLPQPALAAEPRPAVELILDLVRALAGRETLWMERVWAAGRSSPDQGLAITFGEVEWILDREAARREGENFRATDARAVALGAAARRARTALDADPRWRRLSDIFGLDEAECDLLALLVAVEADPGLRRVVAYLNDDVRLGWPSPELATRLTEPRPAPWRDAALRRWRLATPLEEGPPEASTTAWRVDPWVVEALSAEEADDPRLSGAVRRIAGHARDLLPLHEDVLNRLGRAPDLTEIELAGPEGIGRETLAARLAAAQGRTLLAVDTPALLASGLEPREALVRALRQARHAGALAYFRSADQLAPSDWEGARRLGEPFLRGVREPTQGALPVSLQPLSVSERRALWRRWSEHPEPAALETHRLTAAEIRRLAEAGGDNAAGGAAIAGRRPDHALLTALPRPYGWDDLVTPAEVGRALHEFADQIRLRWSVYDKWGFGRLAHLGFGVAALFAGPSGTGKTMAAQVIAKELGLELYRVDLAGVVNKYVGETEKRLREVFDACEHSGALLFFDEADSLFGGRMQVKDAHDRFANIETNYLLQRIETFDGVAILATNRRNEIDHAFLRRLRFVIEFLPPRPQERLALWRRCLHAQAPNGDPLLGEIDFPLLADRLQMTGAEIKNTALAAAFLARAQGERIGMPHLLAAAEREMTKQRAKLPIGLREGGR